MKKKTIFKKFIVCFMLCAMITSGILGFAVNSNALDTDSFGHADCIYYVNSEGSLRDALARSRDNDCIVFENSIICVGDLTVNKNIALNFNHYSLHFIASTNGLVINGNGEVNLLFGGIYASEDSDAAITVRSGDVSLAYMNVFGGDCRYHSWLYYGNVLYCKSAYSVVSVYDCNFIGGNGYSKGIFNPSRTGKAIYGVGILHVGRIGYNEIDGVCR